MHVHAGHHQAACLQAHLKIRLHLRACAKDMTDNIEKQSPMNEGMTQSYMSQVRINRSLHGRNGKI
jgi:hypothetical protein